MTFPTTFPPVNNPWAASELARAQMEPDSYLYTDDEDEDFDPDFARDEALREHEDWFRDDR